MEKKIEVRVQGQDKKVYYREACPDRIRMYYEYTQDNFRKGKDYNLKLLTFARVKNWRQDDKGVLLEIEGDCVCNTQIDSDGELRPIVDEAHETEHFPAFLRLGVYEHGIFRLLAGEGDKEQEHNTVMLEDAPALVPDSFTAVEQDGKLWIRTGTCDAVIGLEEFGFSIVRKDGSLVYRQENNDKVLRFTHESFPFGFAQNPATGERIAVCSSRMDHDESFFGFGEQYSPVDKKMQEVDVFITDPLSVGSPRTYVSLPFYFSTKGYGMYVNTHYRSKFFMGNRSNRSTSFHIYGEPLIDIFYIFGEDPRTILKRYTDITGKSPMVPKWSFGLWMSRCSYKTQEEVLSIARELRERDIPCDVINIDTDWFETAWACDWKFGRHNFPNPEAMIQELDSMGIKVSLWQKPYITSEYLPELKAEMEEKGWLPLNKYGETARSNPVIDLSNPDCCQWYKDQLKSLHKMGVKVIKTDMGEGVPTEGSYHGYGGEEIRNIYPYLYSRAAYEAAKESGLEPILWGRSTYAGGQKYPIHWAGDPFTDFDGLRFSIRSGLSMGMSGFTYWSHDIGGFLGRPTEEVYIRWMQAGMFCSHTRCHGANNPREPWTFGERAETIFRKFDKLRYRLIPYIYSTARKKGAEGLPMMEHLYLANPQDRNCRSIEDEWMFGDVFLVAPVLNEGGTREVYYPQGTWYHYFTGAVISGGQFVDVRMELDDMPLYVKAGSILPMGPETDFVPGDDGKGGGGSKDSREEYRGNRQSGLTICVYYKESGKTEFSYYDGNEYEMKAEFTSDGVTVDLGGLEETVNVRLIGGFGTQEKTDVQGSCKFSIKAG